MSIFADVFYHLVSLNWKLNGRKAYFLGRKICIVLFGTKTTKAIIKGLRCYFQDFYYRFLFKIKPWKCLLINHISNKVSFKV